MILENLLIERSGNKCELCRSGSTVAIYLLPPETQKNERTCIFVCNKCLLQIEKKEAPDSTHWHCLLETMWSEIPALQVLSCRLLNRLRMESWAQDALDLLYLDEENLAWAKQTGDHENDSAVDLHKDSNGNPLQSGDTVVLTKSLDVKGSSLHAKLGTVIKNIRLVPGNAEQIEGRIEGQLMVIVTKYTRKQIG
jgi:protein PhnA